MPQRSKVGARAWKMRSERQYERAELVAAAVDAVLRCLSETERARRRISVERARGLLSWPIRRLVEKHGTKVWQEHARSDDADWQTALDRLLHSDYVSEVRCGADNRSGGERAAAMEAVATVIGCERKTIERDCKTLGLGQRYRSERDRAAARERQEEHDRARGRRLALARARGALKIRRGADQT